MRIAKYDYERLTVPTKCRHLCGRIPAKGYICRSFLRDRRIIWALLGGAFFGFPFCIWKRCGELKEHGDVARKSLEAGGYGVTFPDKNIYVFLACGFVFYSLWAFESIGSFNAAFNLSVRCSFCNHTVLKHGVVHFGNPVTFGSGTAPYILVIPLAMIACMRYSLDIEADGCDRDPVAESCDEGFATGFAMVVA